MRLQWYVLFVMLFVTGCSPQLLSTSDPLFEKKFSDYDYCKFEVVRQAGRTECGAACLTAVLKYWEIPCDYIHVSDMLNLLGRSQPDGMGSRIEDVKAVAQAHGLGAFMIPWKDRPYDSIREMVLKGRPVICALKTPANFHFGYNVPVFGFFHRTYSRALTPRLDHYVVVLGVESERILLMDPAKGFVTLSNDEFLDFWNEQECAGLLCLMKPDKGQSTVAVASR